MKIAIIGTGNLGKSIAKGLITNNAITSFQQDKIVGVTGNNVSKALSVDPNALNRIM